MPAQRAMGRPPSTWTSLVGTVEAHSLAGGKRACTIAGTCSTEHATPCVAAKLAAFLDWYVVGIHATRRGSN